MVFIFIRRLVPVVRKHCTIAKYRLTLGTDDTLQQVTRPRVLRLYRDWMRTLDRTLPCAMREVSKDQVRAFFREGQEEHSIYAVMTLLDAGEDSLRQWKQGDRTSLKHPGFVRPFHMWEPPVDKIDPSTLDEYTEKYTPPMSHR